MATGGVADSILIGEVIGVGNSAAISGVVTANIVLFREVTGCCISYFIKKLRENIRREPIKCYKR